MFKNFFGSRNKDIAIDLGTSNTRVYVKDKGIIVNEPTVVAINNKTDQILAVGQEAKNMLGKTPPHITVTRPLTHGIVSDYEVAEKLMKYFIDKVYDGNPGMMSRPRMVIAVPLEVTEVEMKAVEDAAISAGAKEVYIVQEPMVAAIGARMPIQDPVGNMIVNIGGGNTEVSVISLSGVVIWKSTKVAGDEMNKNIIQYAREVFNLFVGESHAEQIKKKIGSAIEYSEKLEFPMRGRDVVSGLPREVMVSDSHIREALERSVNAIADIVKMTLEITPPELTADIHERGLLLTGGGALLHGIEQVISDAAEVPVRVAGDPQTAVVRGSGILLDNEVLLKEVVLPSARTGK
jgi:rod shape-determining protein MreB and related proteins